MPTDLLLDLASSGRAIAQIRLEKMPTGQKKGEQAHEKPLHRN
jgi:hypothetical protein